jgi:hypothetical protein
MLEIWVPCSREREHAHSVITEDMLTKREHGTRAPEAEMFGRFH